jgi:hypothetical protein
MGSGARAVSPPFCAVTLRPSLPTGVKATGAVKNKRNWLPLTAPAKIGAFRPRRRLHHAARVRQLPLLMTQRLTFGPWIARQV